MLFVLPRLANCIKAALFTMSLGVAKLLLIDANSSIMIHKMMLFMGLGIFILIASFVYQRLIISNAERA